MYNLVSIHGGHSKEFCNHAKDNLEDIIQTYIKKKFLWVGITEHMPHTSNCFLYPDEKEADLTPQEMYKRFENYFSKINILKKKYTNQIKIFAGFETETYAGSTGFVKTLKKTFSPDYIVGSVHHVNGFCFDYSESYYNNAHKSLGGLDNMYCKYFDLQYEMITSIVPEVVGHFDLIRIFDKNYQKRLEKKKIKKRIIRNLTAIKRLGLILDFNLRSLLKGAKEPYISKSILILAKNFGIDIVPGDDSHGIDSAGKNIKQGIDILKSIGISTIWKRPC